MNTYTATRLGRAPQRVRAFLEDVDGQEELADTERRTVQERPPRRRGGRIPSTVPTTGNVDDNLDNSEVTFQLREGASVAVAIGEAVVGFRCDRIDGAADGATVAFSASVQPADPYEEDYEAALDWTGAPPDLQVLAALFAAPA